MNEQRSFAVVLALVCTLPFGCQASGTQKRAGDDAPRTPQKQSECPEPSRTGSLLPQVCISTNLGSFTIEVDIEHAPITSMNFLRYVEAKYYDGTVFHRAVKDFMIQGGDYLPSMDEKTQGRRGPIFLENQTGLGNTRGTIAAARKIGPRSATSGFFINVADNAAKLDYPQPDGFGYAVFGKVVEGMETVDKIATAPVGPHPKFAAGRLPVVPQVPVVITSAGLISSFDRRRAQVLLNAHTKALAAQYDVSRRLTKEQLQEMIEKIEAEAGAKFVDDDDSKIRYIDRRVGNGLTPLLGGRVTIHYRGILANGFEFETSLANEEAPVYAVDELIQGLREALLTMKEGGMRTVIVPPEMAFGRSGIPNRIPPDSTLIYDIELLEVH